MTLAQLKTRIEVAYLKRNAQLCIQTPFVVEFTPLEATALFGVLDEAIAAHVPEDG